ncbi:biotin-dependent carboxyltransferase family protein [Bradyrhizobium sp. LHD-71]|uniref:5-oxoprolinase subunit C family protein n=1 Tax=Bradyrhizobium sp. LHD-71 TaxID=3072141 RepID=UPI00280E422B|nr:biotin-dependent carboxyltransferase family protein [Bradyrhizobium sp. LHD-71]MDQ8728921.1 biotin-dependent carboxyltransferase family protein [Bradyrhizobium sp. LHD-71]
MSKFAVVTVGPLTSVQDGGRYGAQRYGLTSSGAMDLVALAAANTLVGNPPAAAGIEIGPFPASFEVRAGSVRIAVAGAGREIKIDGHMLPPATSAVLAEGHRLDIGAARSGVFSILGIEGAVQGRPLFGSLSVTARAGVGSPFPRPLQAGDELELLEASTAPEQQLMFDQPMRADLRVLPGPQAGEFGEAFALFLASEWTISSTSDRMGYRLDGPTLSHLKGHDIVSDGTVNGSVQVPGNGQPIVLMRDRGTTGGYPKIATVIGPDLGILAQRRAGQTVTFTEIGIEEAQDEARRFAQMIRSLPDHLRAVRTGPNTDALHGANLAGHAVNAFDAATWQSTHDDEH